MKIVAFGASSSKNSINKKMATYVAQLFTRHELEVLDLSHYTIPIFSVDIESEVGYPTLVQEFVTKMRQADFYIISLAEHNGTYTAAFKNLFDWASRIEPKIFGEKPVLLLSTSTGGRGGKSVLEAATTRFPYHGAHIVGTFSLPLFHENFSETTGITQENLKSILLQLIKPLL